MNIRMIAHRKFSSRILKIIVFAIVVLLNPFWGNSALAFSQELQFFGNNGYKIETVFSYEQLPQNRILEEEGEGTTKTIDYMNVVFLAPDGHLLEEYNNIQNGYLNGKYFRFSYDLANKEVLGELDLGGESPGELYFKGSRQKGFSLIKIDRSGKEKIIERFSGDI